MTLNLPEFDSCVKMFESKICQHPVTDRRWWLWWFCAQTQSQIPLSGFVGHSFIPASLMLADGHFHLFDSRGPSCVQGSNTPQPLSQSAPPSLSPSSIHPSLHHTTSLITVWRCILAKPTGGREGKREKSKEGEERGEER